MLTACAPEAPIPGAFESTGNVEVTVNGEDITMDMIEAIIGHMPQSKQDLLLNDAPQKKRFVESLVTSNLLYREALASNLHKEKDVERALAMATREILANLQLSRIGDEAITDDAVQAKYDENKVKYGRPATHLHHFMVREKDVATRLVDEIKAGGDFSEVAKKNDPRTRANGGDLGWITRAPIPDLAEIYASAPENEIIGPVESRMGFHILKIEGRRDKTPIDEVKDQLTQMVKVDAMKNYQLDIKVKADMQWASGGTDTPQVDKDAQQDHGHNGHEHH
jgi:peptidyl-prolyl cis-trans isomerase C